MAARRLRAPHLALASVELAHRGAAMRALVALELLARGIEAQDRILAEIAHPHRVMLVDINGIGQRVLAGHAPGAPRVGRGIEARELARIPLGDPEPPLRIRPHAPRALTRRRRVDHLSGAAGVETREIVARERDEIDIARGRLGDAVGARTARRAPDAQRTILEIEAAIDAALSGEPVMPARVENTGVEIG